MMLGYVPARHNGEITPQDLVQTKMAMQPAEELFSVSINLRIQISNWCACFCHMVTYIQMPLNAYDMIIELFNPKFDMVESTFVMLSPLLMATYKEYD